MSRPHVIVLAGPNGAGKSTLAPALLRDALEVSAFVNADDIARGLSGFAPEAAAVAAGRVMLDRLAALTAGGESFAFETTLSGRGVRRVLERCRRAGYEVHLVFLWLPSADLAVARVRRRVSLGGHDVPEQDVRRRWARGVCNLFQVYLPIATTWRVYDATSEIVTQPVAYGSLGDEPTVLTHATWTFILQQARMLCARKREHDGYEG